MWLYKIGGSKMTEPQLNIPLKACPFARPVETHEVRVINVIDIWWKVQCSCGACGPTDLGESGACDAWNTRYREDTLMREVIAAAEGNSKP